jgi:hypothetical protein
MVLRRIRSRAPHQRARHADEIVAELKKRAKRVDPLEPGRHISEKKLPVEKILKACHPYRSHRIAMPPHPLPTPPGIVPAAWQPST